VERHLDKEEEAKDDEHGDGEDGSWGEQALLLVPHRVEEQQAELLDQQRDDDTVDRTTMDVLVDLGTLVGKVDVVAVHPVLHDHVEEAEGGDEGADDRVGDGEGEDEEHPAVVDPEGEFVDNRLPHRADLRLGSCQQESSNVEDQFREPDDLESRPYERAGDHVVDEEGAVVREEDALPVDPLPTLGGIVRLDHRLNESADRRQADGGKDEHHEEQVAEHLPHDPEVFNRSAPMAEPPV